MQLFFILKFIVYFSTSKLFSVLGYIANFALWSYRFDDKLGYLFYFVHISTAEFPEEMYPHNVGV